MASLMNVIILLLSPVALYGMTKVTIDSITVTQIQDPEIPTENPNAYVVTSSRSFEGFFVDTGFTDATTSALISTYQEQVRSTTKPPSFIFITHGHLDHVGGIARILETYPTVPIYAISQQVIVETVRFVNRRCAMVNFSIPSCLINYSNVMRVIKSPKTELTFGEPSVKLSALSFITQAETFYAGLLGMKAASGEYFLFSGDVITIDSHLYPNNFFHTSGLPGIDDALCGWAGMMQSYACDLQLGKRRSTILPGHGPISDTFQFAKHIGKNIEWLRTLRNLTFNSCNSTYIWGEMIRQYPTFGETTAITIGALANHVPTDANSVHCNCQNGSPMICPVYNSPPSCIHLDITDSDTTVACDMRIRSYSSASRPLFIELVIIGLSAVNILIVGFIH